MTPEFVISFGRDAFLVALLLAGPALAVGLVVGFLISIFQAVTQIQELTLTIIPKIVAIVITLIILYPWILSKATDFFRLVLTNFPSYIGQ
ncbi:MAG: flagellar biosynthesis protein FliQ [SAR324 cluster bacterium]|nr:flagellar biosynthesis protein FliQ [SAR324 cluster bacterium]